MIPGDVVVVSTGGAGQLYRYTTNPEVATGDGVALAYLAGAEVMDMEFYQFHPTALWLQGAPTFLLSEAMRGEGAILRNPDGEPFMSGVSSRWPTWRPGTWCRAPSRRRWSGPTGGRRCWTYRTCRRRR